MSGTINLPRQNLLLTGYAVLILMVLSSETASANSPSVVQDPLQEAFTQLRDHLSQRILLSARVQMLAGTRLRIHGAEYFLKWRTNYYRQLTLAAWRGSHFQLTVHHRLVKDLIAAWRSDTRRNSISEVLSSDDPILGDILHLVSINQMEPTGTRGRPGKIATVLLKSGAMVKVTLKILNLLDCAKQLKQEYHSRLQASQPAVSPKDRLRKLQAGRSISISRPSTSQSAAPTPSTLLGNVSADSSWNPATPSTIDSKLEFQEQSPTTFPPSNDTLRDLLKERLGASSLSPMPSRLDLSASAACGEGSGRSDQAVGDSQA